MSEPNGRNGSSLPPAEIEKLLGGYATGTLTPAEKSALMTAALSDQALFDALGDEEALRELMADDASRQALLAAIAPAAPPRERWWAALWRPRTLVFAGSLAAALLVAVMLRPVVNHVPQPSPATEIAAAKEQPAPALDEAVPRRDAAGGPPQQRQNKSDAPGQPRKYVPPAESAAKAKDLIEPPAAPQPTGQVAAGPAPPAASPPPPAAPVALAKEMERKSRDADGEARKAAEKPVTADPVASRLADSRGRAATVEADRQEAVAKSSNQMAQTLGAAQNARPQSSFRAVSAAVTAVSGNNVTINAGRDLALAPGDILLVRRSGTLLGELQLTELEGSSAKGFYRGATPPRVGDIVFPKPKE